LWLNDTSYGGRLIDPEPLWGLRPQTPVIGVRYGAPLAMFETPVLLSIILIIDMHGKTTTTDKCVNK